MIDYNFDQEFYLTKNSKDITEITHEELCLMKHLLKEELSIISSKTRYQTIKFLEQTERFTELLEDFLFHTTCLDKTYYNELIGSYRTLLDSFSVFESIPYANKQNELFDNK